MSHPDGLNAEEVLAFLTSQGEPSPAESQPAQVQAYREAAAVLAAVEDPESLRPLGGPPTTGGAVELLGDEFVPATGHKFEGRVMLTPGVRAETIRELVSTGRLEEALAANPGQRNGSLQAHFERYLRRQAPPLDQQSLGELEATRQISLWLGDVIEGVPTVAEVDARVAYRKLLGLFETLAGDAVFRGRVRQLDELRHHIGVVPPETLRGRVRGAFRWAEPERQPAVSISGVGGAGKSSLMARFMLEHTRLPEDSRVPFGYLDFARASLDVGDQLGLCVELLRQLDLQFPGNGRFAEIRDKAARLPESAGKRPAQPRARPVTELRVSGVSESPPGLIPDEQTPRQVSGDAVAGFYRPPGDGDLDLDLDLDAGPAADRRVEVYSWGGGTRRGMARVLWLALLPFLLGNLAGWMCSAATRSSCWRFRLHRLASGLGALALTVNAALIAVLISADMLGYQTTRAGIAGNQWWLAPLGWPFVAGHPARQVTLGIVVVLLFVLALIWLSSRGWRYEAVRPPFRVSAPGRDTARMMTAAALPAGLADDEFWDGDNSARLTTYMHLTVVLGFLAIALGVIARALAVSPRATALGWTAIALGAAAVALGAGYIGADALTTPAVSAPDTASSPDSGAHGGRFRVLASYLPALAAAALVIAVVFAWLQPTATAGHAADLPGMARVTGWTTLAIALVLVLALVSALAGLRGSRGTLAGGSWATLMLGFAILNAGMLGAGIWVAHLVGPVTSDAAIAAPSPSGGHGQIYLPYLITSGVPLVACAAVLAVAAFALAEGVRWLRARRLPVSVARQYQDEAAAFRNQLTGPRKQWYWSGLPPFAPPGNPAGDAGTGAGWERQVARAHFAGGMAQDAAWLLWAVVLATLVMAVSVWRLHFVPPTAIRNLGTVLAVLTLPALMGLLYLTWGDRAGPYSIKDWWEAGMFWPRSYHPLAPPCYAERAVPELQRRMWWLHDDGGHVMLVAHGHGAVLAAVALLQPGCRPEDDQPTLITFGSPAGKIYGWAFPAYFGRSLLEPLEPGSSGRLHDWHNFYYPTDLIGGPAALGLATADRDPADIQLLDPSECFYVYGQRPPVPAGRAGYWADPRVWSVVNHVTWPEEEPEDQPEILAGDQLAVARNLLAEALEWMRRALGPRPYVVVLDTFEEVQYRGEERALKLWEMLDELQERAPFLRVVVAGRAPVESLVLAGRPPRQMELGGLDDEAAMAFLRAQGITDKTLQAKLVDTVGRLPLSLKLVSTLAKQTRGGPAALLDPHSGLSLLAASDEVLQGELYGRILDHIADDRVRRLAHPGLVLRRINAELIFEVLNEPCGLGIETPAEAQELFDELRRESSLVSVDSSDGDLVHRRELREVMLNMLLTSAPAEVEQIRRRAAAWYADQAGRRGKAEELYYRLHLGEQVDQRELSDPEVRSSIQAAIEEFPAGVQLRLSTFGLKINPEISGQADREQHHASLAAQIENLLPYGASALDQAREVLATARDGAGRPFGSGARAEASPLFRAGARIAAQGGDEGQALDLIERGLERATREGEEALNLGLLQERAWLYRTRDRAGQADGLARLGERARRHQDRLALLQYLAQSIDQDDPGSLHALGNVLSKADPADAWGLVAALGPAVELARRTQDEAVLAHLESLVRAPGSPFQLTVFPDPISQAALGTLRAADSGAFARAFLRLVEVWPYRILFVAAPYGRGGEQLREV